MSRLTTPYVGHCIAIWLLVGGCGAEEPPPIDEFCGVGRFCSYNASTKTGSCCCRGATCSEQGYHRCTEVVTGIPAGEIVHACDPAGTRCGWFENCLPYGWATRASSDAKCRLPVNGVTPYSSPASAWAADVSPIQGTITEVTATGFKLKVAGNVREVGCCPNGIAHPLKVGDSVSVTHCAPANSHSGVIFETLVIRDLGGRLLLVLGHGAESLDRQCLPGEFVLGRRDIQCPAVTLALESWPWRTCSRANFGLLFRSDSTLELWTGQTGTLTIKGGNYHAANGYSFDALFTQGGGRTCDAEAKYFASFALARQ